MRSVFLLAFFISITAADLEKFRKDCLDAHNEIRSQLALGKFRDGQRNVILEPAANMVKLQWDADLELSARKYAEKCEFKHSQAQVNGKAVGENIFMKWSTKKGDQFALANTSVKNWASEEWETQPRKNKKEPLLFKLNHATQVGWAESTKVGCHSQLREEVEGKGYTYFVFCQYQPQGNMAGAEVYITGTACSKCPEGTECEKSTGLCMYPGPEIKAPKEIPEAAVCSPSAAGLFKRTAFFSTFLLTSIFLASGFVMF